MPIPNLPNEQPRPNQKNVFLRYPKSTLIVIGLILVGVGAVMLENWLRFVCIGIWVILFVWLFFKNPESRL